LQRETTGRRRRGEEGKLQGRERKAGRKEAQEKAIKEGRLEITDYTDAKKRWYLRHVGGEIEPMGPQEERSVLMVVWVTGERR
jgi:hypothetical protein